MTKKNLYVVFLVGLSLLICLGTYKVCYFIAENYFFDKIFYRKSVAHGYSANGYTDLKFGKRIEDITALKSHQKIFTDKFNNYYKVVVIGDSYVWGMGLRNDQRFSVLLENKLNQLRPTKVISFGEPGNGALDYLRWFDQASQQENFNISIFSLVNNDASVDLPSYTYNYPDYRNIISTCQAEFPNIKPISLQHSINTNSMADNGYSINQINNAINTLQDETWNNPINLCVTNKALSLLPSDKAIYFFGDAYFGNESACPTYTRLLNNNNKTVLSSILGKNMSKYSNYWVNNIPNHYFNISRTESHPNATANQMYADILFKEITTNPKWQF